MKLTLEFKDSQELQDFMDELSWNCTEGSDSTDRRDMLCTIFNKFQNAIAAEKLSMRKPKFLDCIFWED